MEKLWSANEIGALIGISGSTVKLWQDQKLIPEATRLGRLKKRVWGKYKVRLILEFARDIAGYPVPDRIFEQVKRS